MSIDSDVTVGGKSISAVVDGETPDEVLGHCTMTTTGDNMLIPEDWLEEQWEKHDLPHGLFPKRVRPWMAYTRMINTLLDRDTDEEMYIETEDREFEVSYSLDSGEGKVRHLVAHVFFPEEVIGESEGKIVDRNLGYFDYQRPDDDAGYPPLAENERVLHEIDNDEYEARVIAHRKVDPGTKFHRRWQNRFVARAKGLFVKMLNHKIGQDMRDVIDDFLFERTNTVRYQNGTYFVGAGYSDTIEGLSAVWEKMNQFKKRGQRCKIRTIPVMNTEKQREYIKEEVWAEAEERINAAIDEGLEKLESEVEEDAEAVAQEIVEATVETENFAEEYNKLLDTEIEVREILRERRSELVDEKEEVLSRVLDQRQLDNFEE